MASSRKYVAYRDSRQEAERVFGATKEPDTPKVEKNPPWAPRSSSKLAP